MKQIPRPIIKHVDPQQFLVVQFMHIKREEIVCPNCGHVSNTHIIDISALDTLEKRKKNYRLEPFKTILGLCSEECCEEFFGGIHHVFEQG